ncbi:MAG: hypothetical protein Q8L26_06465 [Candidatus Omnitrophota bacterium]|nr:hypothetical protein [Candidatus Omnitrophota bacterium]
MKKTKTFVAIGTILIIAIFLAQQIIAALSKREGGTPYLSSAKVFIGSTLFAIISWLIIGTALIVAIKLAVRFFKK